MPGTRRSPSLHGIDVSLGGTLELLFAPDVNVASQVGRTIDLFDWTGVAPTGAPDVSVAFGAFAVDSPYSWDLSKLYTTGEVTLTAIPEPASWTLVGIAFVTTLARRRRLASGATAGPPQRIRRGELAQQ